MVSFPCNLANVIANASLIVLFIKESTVEQIAAGNLGLERQVVDLIDTIATAASAHPLPALRCPIGVLFTKPAPGTHTDPDPAPVQMRNAVVLTMNPDRLTRRADELRPLLKAH